MCWACPRRRPRLAPSKTSCESLQRNFEALAPETPFARARTLVRGSLPRHARHARSALGTRGTRPFPPRRAPNATTFPLRNCLAQAHVQRQCRQSFVPGAGEEDSAQGALPASQGARHWRTPLTTRRARTACTFPPRVTTHKTARPLPLGAWTPERPVLACAALVYARRTRRVAAALHRKERRTPASLH